jgi:hypothetical protein
VELYRQNALQWWETVRLSFGVTRYDATFVIRSVYETRSALALACLTEARYVSAILADTIIDDYLQSLGQNSLGLAEIVSAAYGPSLVRMSPPLPRSRRLLRCGTSCR